MFMSVDVLRQKQLEKGRACVTTPSMVDMV